MIRILYLIAALTGAAALSQAPEFSQQYLQRLAGQVDELTRIVDDFDQTALADGMGREEMLQAMAQTPVVAPQVDLWRRVFARHARLAENLMILRGATPLERLTMPHRMADPETVQAVWADYTPAMPLSGAGALSAVLGFVMGWVLLAALIAVVMAPLRMMRRLRRTPDTAQRAVKKQDPPVMQPLKLTDPVNSRPRLDGVKR